MISSKEDVIREWSQLLEDMDLPCSECPIRLMCMIDESYNTKCIDILNKVLTIADDYAIDRGSI